MGERVEQILANYSGENPGVIGNLRRLMNTAAISGRSSGIPVSFSMMEAIVSASSGVR